MPSREFLLRLLERSDMPAVAWEDFQGPHGKALFLWQQLAFLDAEPGQNPIAGCPHCDEGVPYLLGERYLCNRCFSTVDPRHLLLWRLRPETFLSWLARGLHLRGEVRQIEEGLWQLGTWESEGTASECFYRRGRLGEDGRKKLSLYRGVVVFYGLTAPADLQPVRGSSISLLTLLHEDEQGLSVLGLADLLHADNTVRFEPASGALRVGGISLGEVPLGSKEYFLLLCLSEQQDEFVPYSDLKQFVLRRTGSRDSTEEATFCQLLKSRIKKQVPTLDRVIAKTNRGDGFRLRKNASC